MTMDTKMLKDEARENHLKEIQKIKDEMAIIIFDKDRYEKLNKKLNLYLTQLKLYDKIMGYSKLL